MSTVMHSIAPTTAGCDRNKSSVSVGGFYW